VVDVGRRAVLLSVAIVATVILVSELASARAIVNERIHQRVKIDSTAYACNLVEPIAISGTALFVFRVTQDANGGLHFLDGHVNYQGVAGEGLLSGENYRVVFAENVLLNANSPEGSQAENTATITYKVISTGPTPNLVGHFTQHYTFDANGKFIGSHDTSNEGCNG
jgi:hypothetical protein